MPSNGLTSTLLFWNQRSKATPVLLAGRSHDGDAFEQKPVLDIPLKFVEERLLRAGNDPLGQRFYLNKGITRFASSIFHPSSNELISSAARLALSKHRNSRTQDASRWRQSVSVAAGFGSAA